MWIQVRSIDGKKTVRVDDLSKLTKIEELRKKLVDPFEAPVETQRLFFRGKQLVDAHTLFDYGVNVNDLIQLLVTPGSRATSDSADKHSQSSGYSSAGEDGNSSDKENQKPPSPKPETASGSCETEDEDCSDSLYKHGDVIDARDVTIGAWFEAKILKIRKKKDGKEEDVSSSKSDSSKTSASTSRTILGENAEFKSMLEKEKAKVGVKHEVMDCGGTTTPVKRDIANPDSQQDEGSQEVKSENTNTESTPGTTDNSENSKECIKSENDTNVEMKSVDENANEKFESSKDIINPKTTDGYVYHIIFEGYEEDVVEVSSNNIRPRARQKVKLSDVKCGDHVLVNYNYDDHAERGFWYDCIVSGKRDTRTIKELMGTVFIGADLMPLEDCKILFVDEIFSIEKAGTQLNEMRDADNPAISPAKRKNKPECDHCHDNPRRKCKHCACCVCGGKDNPGRQILCDECDQAYHLDCLNPPLETVPDEDEWYCPSCKVDTSSVVKAGEKLKESKKKSKMASATSKSSRDWGKGMACVGRTKMCTLVPPNHFGPVPGVEVGMMWKFRVQVSEAGCHRPHVAGIHGREDEGAYSIVLSGGYEDDKDDGDEFTYTGSGGRDLSGNKRTAEQSCDQVLTRMNKALAKNCNAPINAKNGGDSKEGWRDGKPVRVVRNCKGSRHSKYAPLDGNRYDGIYKIVKYWPEAGKSGFLVWRYLLRRDDPTPSPWSAAGKKRIKQMGFEMQYPDGYQEAQALKDKEKEEAAEATPKGRGRKKRKAEDSPVSTPKKAKVSQFKIESEQLDKIKEDNVNKKLWEEVMEFTKEGRPKFIQKMEETFICICCQDVVVKPVTLECSHNVCKSCLQRSFKAEVYSCPACRFELPQKYNMPVNTSLSAVLNHYFPGYEVGR
ncbi:E3 ubiquitin-protein ligase UHRF1-like [Haliotis asinina]|uniref:E3 ubiquitin-protein ligase UHRF1-like n=1 Tax=Haliotis asinina TaxID=109174 RepID=UPI003531E444